MYGDGAVPIFVANGFRRHLSLSTISGRCLPAELSEAFDRYFFA
jgi:hypothetical protein